MSTFPSVVATLPNPNATDRLNIPSHSALHQSENAEIVQIETFIGTNASAVGTLTYDIRSPLSNGGGHIQTANKGGTGQTTYNKGDLLVGQSSSVISKLVVGADGQTLVADSGQQLGVKWATPGGTKIGVSGIQTSVVGTVTETSLFSVVIPASTLGTSNAVRSTVLMPYVSINTASNIDVAVFWGPASVAFFHNVGANGANQSYFGRLETQLLATGSQSSQLSITTLQFFHGTNVPQVASILAQGMQAQVATVDSGSAQTFGATVKLGGSAGDRVNIAGYVVERIV